MHKNARLTPQGRALLVHRVRGEAWRVAQAAEAAGVSKRTAYRWLARKRAGEGFGDRSSAPRRSPRRLGEDRVAAIERLRRERMSGPKIARTLGLALSTVGAILRRLGLGKLAALDPRPPILRYERANPGELIHLDIKTLGKIDGVGHRITGHYERHHRARRVGHEHLHVAIDDASRLAYTEILPSLGQQDATAFLKRARSPMPAHAISEPGLTPRAPMARPSASSRPVCANGPMCAHTPRRPNEPQPSDRGPTATTSSARTQPSATNRQSQG